MRESDTYMEIVEEGIAKGLEKGMEKGLEQGQLREVRKLILNLGKQSLGKADDSVAIALGGIVDLDRLERLFERIREAQSWQELLATP